jgi:hypothetical protein
MSKMALPAPLDSPSYWRRLLATCHPDKPDGDHDLFIFLEGLREHVDGCTSLSDRATRPERTVWDDFVETAEAYNEWERASHLFSASSRLRPLEHYLA